MKPAGNVIESRTSESQFQPMIETSQKRWAMLGRFSKPVDALVNSDTKSHGQTMLNSSE